LLTGRHVSAIFLSNFQAQEGTRVQDPIRCAFYLPELWFLIGPEDG